MFHNTFLKTLSILTFLVFVQIVIPSCTCPEVTKFYSEIVQVYSENIDFGAQEPLDKESEADSVLMRFVFEYDEWETDIGNKQSQLQAASCPHPEFELQTTIEGISMFLMRNKDGKIEQTEIDTSRIFVYYEQYWYNDFRTVTDIIYWEQQLNQGGLYLANPWFIVIKNLSKLKEGEYIKTEFELENGTTIVAQNVSDSPPN